MVVYILHNALFIFALFILFLFYFMVIA